MRYGEEFTTNKDRQYAKQSLRFSETIRAAYNTHTVLFGKLLTAQVIALGQYIKIYWFEYLSDHPYHGWCGTATWLHSMCCAASNQGYRYGWGDSAPRVFLLYADAVGLKLML